MPDITIKEFKGINLDEGLWQQGYARYVVGLDIFGLAKNPSKISLPGISQGIFDVSAGAQAASPSAVTELVLDFTRFNTNDFAIGADTTGRIYRRDSGTWKWVSAITVSGAASPAAALKTYGANLYYAQAAVLGRYDNTNGNANFQTLADSTVSPRVMVILNGSLYGANNRYIWKYDGTTFTSQALILPSDMTIRSMDIWGDEIYAFADNAFTSRLFIWDGVSNTYKTSVELSEETTAPSIKTAGGILWFVANRGSSTTGTPIYTFNGSEFKKELTLPIKRNATVGLWDYGGGLAIGSNEGASAAFEDGIAGVWLINRHSVAYPWFAVLGFPLRDRLTNFTLGGMTFFNQNGYIAAQDISNSSFEIFELQGSKANATNIWQSLRIDAGSNNYKQWHGIKINAEDLVTGQTVVVKYRLDDDTSFTTLKTFTTSNYATDMDRYILIGRTSRQIVIRIELTASDSETTRLHSFTLDYSLAGL